MRVVLVEFPWHVKKILSNKGSFEKDVIVSLDAESSYDLKNNKTVIIHSDSQYSIKCLTKWYKKWELNNWINMKKKTVVLSIRIILLFLIISRSSIL